MTSFSVSSSVEKASSQAVERSDELMPFYCFMQCWALQGPWLSFLWHYRGIITGTEHLLAPGLCQVLGNSVVSLPSGSSYASSLGTVTAAPLCQSIYTSTLLAKTMPHSPCTPMIDIQFLEGRRHEIPRGRNPCCASGVGGWKETGGVSHAGGANRIPPP